MSFDIDMWWNPVRGCTPVSQGCTNCRAARFAGHLAGAGVGYDHLARWYPTGPAWTGVVQMLPERLRDPLRWHGERHVSVCNMSDLFHERVHDEFIRDVYAVMAMTPQHGFYIETKWAARMQQWFGSWACGQLIAELDETDRDWPLPNVYQGISAENQWALDDRTHALLSHPAAGHYIVLEPLLSSVDLEHVECPMTRGEECHMCTDHDGHPMSECVDGAFNALEQGVDWVVVGCETGPRAQIRPTETEWIHDVVEQCKRNGIPVYYNKPAKERGRGLPIHGDRLWGSLW